MNVNVERAFGLIHKLRERRHLSREEFVELIGAQWQRMESAKKTGSKATGPEEARRILACLAKNADEVRRAHYGRKVYIRGLIEFTSYCQNDCLYCGLRRSNQRAERYRLTREEILSCCAEGYALGFRTFVLQGGEDPAFTPDAIADIVYTIKKKYPDCAVTLSVGEWESEVYKLWFAAGADRYLLRHETADFDHYHRLHPKDMSPEHRQQCLKALKAIGYQTGCGIMVGSPGQTPAHIAEDLLFMEELQPEMVGMGPFIPQKDTPFGQKHPGTLEQTLFLLGIVRLMLPHVLLPATTALGTIHPEGRELGMQTGANVCMPNLSPAGVRGKYAIYDNKIAAGSESAENLSELKARMAQAGYQVVTDRGDFLG